MGKQKASVCASPEWLPSGQTYAQTGANEGNGVRASPDWARWRLRRAVHARALRRLVRGLPSPVLLTDVPGNTGDLLIASGVDALLGDIVVDRVRYGEQDGRNGRSLVIPGSGAWSQTYHEWLPELVLEASSVYEHVLVLPSSYDPSVPVVRRALARENVIAISREHASAVRVADLGHLRTHLDCAVFSHHLRHPVPVPHPEASLLALRTDLESALDPADLPSANRDLSAGPPDLSTWLTAITGAGRVVTDRAHVMLAATLLGRQVEFTNGGYWKNAALAETTFRGLFRHRLVYRSPTELLARVAVPC